MGKTPAHIMGVLQNTTSSLRMSQKLSQSKKNHKWKKKQDIVNQDTVVFTPDESEEEPFNTAIDDTSDDPTIVMGKPVTNAFVSDDVRIPTEKVGCLQVTSQLQGFLNHFPPESIEKAFEQIYQILQVLDAFLIENPQRFVQFSRNLGSTLYPLRHQE